MEKQELLYEGKAKQVYKTEDPNLIILRFKDDANAYGGIKKAIIENKGIYNNKIMTILFKYLVAEGIPTHYIETLNDREMLCKKVDILNFDVSVRNVVAGGMSKRFHIPEGTRLKKPVIELGIRRGVTGNKLINDYHVVALDLLKENELKYVYELTEKINTLLVGFFKKINVDLVDYKLEFGKTADGDIILADELSPDTCRLWDTVTGTRLDIDRFRKDFGKVVEGYVEILKRVEKLA